MFENLTQEEKLELYNRCKELYYTGEEESPLSDFEFDQLEKQLDTLHKKLTALETVLADNSLYEQAQKEQLKQHLSTQSELLQQQAQLEETWLNSLEELEALQSKLEANL